MGEGCIEGLNKWRGKGGFIECKRVVIYRKCMVGERRYDGCGKV